MRAVLDIPSQWEAEEANQNSGSCFVETDRQKEGCLTKLWRERFGAAYVEITNWQMDRGYAEYDNIPYILFYYTGNAGLYAAGRTGKHRLKKIRKVSCLSVWKNCFS